MCGGRAIRQARYIGHEFTNLRVGAAKFRMPDGHSNTGRSISGQRRLIRQPDICIRLSCRSDLADSMFW